MAVQRIGTGRIGDEREPLESLKSYASGTFVSVTRSRYVTAALFLAGMLVVNAAATPAHAATSQLPRRFPILAAVPVLQYIQSQQLPNGHVRVLLQFNGPVQMRVTSAAATADFIIQFPNAVSAPTVPTLIPVNLGLIQSVNLAITNNALSVALLLQSPAVPKISTVGTMVVVDVPPTGLPAPNAGAQIPAQQPQAQVSSGATVTQIVHLHYADLSEVVGVLAENSTVTPTNVFNPQPAQLGMQNQPGFNSQFGNGQAIQPFQQYQPQTSTGEEQALGQRVTDNIAIDRRLNSVILTGSRQQVAQMVALINQIDVPVESILLDTQVIEVNENGMKAIGLDYDQSSGSPLTKIFNTQSQIINNLPAGVVAGSIAIQSNIWALVTQGHARVLASPKILTQDGQSASILTGDSLPIRVTTPVGVGGVGAVSSQVEYINVGVTLQILPRVTGNGGVDANVYSQVSSVTGFDSSNDPQISTRQAQTKVNLMEGQTLVIGGLLQEQDIHNLQKIPILGDIPILGALFRYYTETKQNTNLVITVTPHIVPAPVAPAGESH